MSVNPVNVGDIVSMDAHSSVPAELVGKFFRVESVSDQGWTLSLPYEDAECTRRYYSEFGLRTSPGYRAYVKEQRQATA